MAAAIPYRLRQKNSAIAYFFAVSLRPHSVHGTVPYVTPDANLGMGAAHLRGQTADGAECVESDSSVF